jgi:hypothetical protein
MTPKMPVSLQILIIKNQQNIIALFQQPVNIAVFLYFSFPLGVNACIKPEQTGQFALSNYGLRLSVRIEAGEFLL